MTFDGAEVRTSVATEVAESLLSRPERRRSRPSVPEPRSNEYGDPPEMVAALEADALTLARTGRYGSAYPRYCAAVIEAAHQRADTERAEREAAEVRARLDAHAARMRAHRASRKEGPR